VYDIKQVTGTEVDEGAVCRFLRKNNLSRKEQQHTALQWSEELRLKFLLDHSLYSPEILLPLDEMGCDRCSSQWKFGYGLLGKRAPSVSLLVHGVRYSAIGILTAEGIQDTWTLFEVLSPRALSTTLFAWSEEAFSKIKAYLKAYEAAIQAVPNEDDWIAWMTHAG